MSGKGDYPIGRGRPPQWTQFRKGVSGNPRGRPRKEKPDRPVPNLSAMHKAILKVGDQKIPGKIGGKTVDMTYLEAVVQKQAAVALGGNPLAQRDFIGARIKAEKELAALLAHKQQEQKLDFEQALAWRDHRAALWAKAERQGREPADPWPHPDDFLFDYSKLSRRIRGPAFEEDVGFFGLLLAQRDQHILDEVAAWYERAPAESRNATANFYRFLWGIYDELLPKRWQVDLDRIELKIDWLVLQPLHTIRTLQRECEARVRSLRRHDRPGTKESYAKDNRIMKLLLKPLGYHSLAHFNSVHNSL